jgi:hypothetical protein
MVDAVCSGLILDSVDIRSRPTDPEVEQLARSIYSMFPRCMRCGKPIGSYEEADVRILSHRVVHRERCMSDQMRPEASADAR